jgi:zinc protease
VFGTHPYGQSVTVASVKAIETQDLQRFHQRFFTPCRARVSMVGDLQRADVERIARTLLSRLPKAQSCAALAPLPTLPAVQALGKGKTVALAFAASQAHVLMGQPGIARDDARYFPLTVGNYILGGGGFVSRLTDQVREKRGLSYSVYSYFYPELQTGPFTIGLQTRKDQAHQALAVVGEVLDDFVSHGPTPAELQAAKDNLIGGFALRIDNNKKLLDNVANIAWYGLPLDYLQTWTQAVQGVTLESIHEAFKSVLDPKTMVTVIVGEPS